MANVRILVSAVQMQPKSLHIPNGFFLLKEFY